MYDITLILHNLIRWLIVILGIATTVLAWIGWLGKQEWTERNRKLITFFGIVMDVQLLVGLVLYFGLSPFGAKAFADFGMSFVMQQADYRFFSVEHLSMMILAVIFAHLASVFPKRAQSAAAKYRAAAIFLALAMLLILASTPWARPLLRWG